ncbi:MAG: methyltransferase domain-containing protein [Gemmatimonadetes bacterium]|nr:methyltransferase domain-containing protein [Gemmatimonadota bacterium]
MTDRNDPALQQQQSWRANAAAWTQAIRERQIESRRLATDAAILSAVVQHSPRRVLDVGCGEGWLARALAAYGVSVVGVDASPPLIESARAAGGGAFHVLSYAEIAAGPGRLGTNYDAAVCNFSLLEENLTPLLAALRSALSSRGSLFIQTIHPWVSCGEAPYQDGWRTETFDSFGGAFAESMPCYFRTLESWFKLLREAGFGVVDLREPLHPDTDLPLSLLLVCRVRTQ